MELEDLLQSADIVEYISQYVELEEKGGEFWGLSPFTDEKTPSFSVRKESGSWYDFSSGKGGNLFTFIKLYNRCTAGEAVEKLKEYIGYDGEFRTPRKKMSATMTCEKFAKPKKRVKERSGIILPDNHMEIYEKRDDKLSVWKDEGISDESLERFEVRYDAFSDRLVYPIRNKEGKIVNVCGRTLDPLWKEKKLRKYTYFHSWGVMDVIYGLAENMEYIREEGEIILFEGCKSVLLADTWGIRNTGAILTSHLNPQQMSILATLGVRVLFALDKEVNIRNDHNIAKLKRYTNVGYLWDKDNLLADKDSPVDKGKEVFETLYEQRLLFRQLEI